MGDGETAVCGVEIAGIVRLQVEVIKRVQTKNPIVETNEAFYAIASAQTLDEAGQLAAESMFAFLRERLPALAAND
ncbi:acetamidase/formamidase family protein, partial [Microbacteriaceae bacterium K1510]|nr:acetamidase/formamidase family protein [Microbacteriaceae bacterium K1510]